MVYNATSCTAFFSCWGINCFYVDMSTNEQWLPLKVFGVLKTQTKQFVLRFQEERYYFPFDKNDAQSKTTALKRAERKQTELTMRNSKVNHFSIDKEQNIAKILLFSDSQKERRVVGVTVIDLEDLEKVRPYYWSIRYDHYNNKPQHVCTKQGLYTRLRLDQLVFGDKDILLNHIDDDLFNCRKGNLIEQGENTLSDEENTSEDANVGEDEDESSSHITDLLPESVQGSHRDDTRADLPMESPAKKRKIGDKDGESKWITDAVENDNKCDAATLSTGVPVLDILSDTTLQFESLEDEIRQYCFPEGAFIPKSVWLLYRKAAKSNKSTELRIIAAMATVLFEHYPTFPTPVYSNMEILADLHHAFNSVRKISPRQVKFGATLAPSRQGNAISKHFAGRAMTQVSYSASRTSGSINSRTVDETWKINSARTAVCRIVLMERACVKFTPNALWAAMSMSYYIPGNFPAVACAHLIDVLGYRLFLARKEQTVTPKLRFFDPCSGWGGRFVGFWISRYFGQYVGIDPNPRLVPAYRSIGQFLSTHFAQPTEKKFQFIQACAEDMDVWQPLLEQKDAKFDVVFTSPPYFDVEMYGREEQQSGIRYGNSYNQWLNNFMFKMLLNASKVCCEDGFIVLNIANCARCPSLVEDTSQHMTGTMGYKLVETVDMYMPRRPFSSNADKKGSEPILIFQKK